MSDLISRQAATRKLKRMATQAYIDKLNGSAETVINCCIDVIERQIPSAQPEIVRCKDCRFNTYSKKCLNPDSFFLVPADDFYCGYAERRTDEAD